MQVHAYYIPLHHVNMQEDLVCYFSANLLIHTFLKFYLEIGNLDGNRYSNNC